MYLILLIKIVMKKQIVLFGLSTMFLLAGNLTISSQIVVKVIPPKPKVILPHPAKQKHGHVWIDGHWKWSKKNQKYVWVKGHWEKPPRPGSIWVPGHWVDTQGGYKWVPGHWKKPKPLRPKP
ncbi:MAG TPA: hypothetical protein EYP69_03050 [Bacteroidales bacterium]|nr:hypothetical protein [Bacteroidales bacterium]